MDAGARQAAACGEGERGGPEPPEAGAEASSKLLKSPWSLRDKKNIYYSVDYWRLKLSVRRLWMLKHRINNEFHVFSCSRLSRDSRGHSSN